MGMSRDGAELVGYLAGGAVVASFGYLSAFIVDAASYLVSAALLTRLQVRCNTREFQAASLDTGRRHTEQYSVVSGRHLLSAPTCSLLCSPSCAIGFYVPNAYGLVLDVFHGGGFELGMLEWAVGCGLIVGGLAMSRAVARGRQEPVCGGFEHSGSFCLLGVYFAGSLWLSICLVGFAGMASVGMTVPSITMMQETSSEEHKGRMIAIRGRLRTAECSRRVSPRRHPRPNHRHPTDLLRSRPIGGDPDPPDLRSLSHHGQPAGRNGVEGGARHRAETGRGAAGGDGSTAGGLPWSVALGLRHICGG